jgi:hypothetical protein
MAAKTQSPQMRSLLKRYGVTTERALIRAIRDEYNRECVEDGEEKYTLFTAELMLDEMLEAEYQRLASTGGR